MNKNIIGIVGFIGSGKGTVGLHLTQQYNFKAVSFASSLKDAVSHIFNWPRDLLEGDTSESRIWRELPDPWWSEKFGKVITPRWVFQNIGTDVFRNHFHTDIWVWSLENKIKNSQAPVVITDVRFDNEIQMIKQLNGKILWVKRGEDPEWLQFAIKNVSIMPFLYPSIHPSEYSWLSRSPDHIIYNNGTLVDLYKQIDDFMKD
jgi:hypothetical protein